MELTLNEYLSGLKGQRVAVVGIGVSNTPLIRLLVRAGVKVTACDKRTREQFNGQADALESLGVHLQLGPDYRKGLEDYDVIFRTPGLRPDVPELEQARARGALLTSEMEAFFQVCPCKLLAVTGSDGKTTTTSIIAGLLKQAGYNTYVGGNIGKPLLADAGGMSPEDMAVVELSSFQLMTMDRSPEIAVVTNLAPNHLDVHKSMEEYVQAKQNIYRHQNAGGLVVLNYDNAITRGFAADAVGEVTFFSRRERLEKGVYVEDGAIWVSNDAGTRRVLPVEVIRAFAASFQGVEHRIELVRTLGGVRYYNDSIASSPSRTIAGLRCFPEKVILIAGGYDKHIPFDTLGPEIVAHVKKLFLTGATAEKIRAAVEAAPNYAPGRPEIAQIDDFQDAVMAAHWAAEPGDVVLLSPAGAAFDKFKNFMERGETFKRIVNELK